MTYSDKDRDRAIHMNTKEDEIILCIPIMDITIENDYIHYIFNKLNISVEKISQYINKNNENVKRVILHLKNIHYQHQYQPTIAQTIFDYIKSRLEQNKDVKIVYNYPHYWKMVKAYK